MHILELTARLCVSSVFLPMLMLGCGAAADPAEPADSALEAASVEPSVLAPTPAPPEAEAAPSAPLKQDGLLREPPTGNYRVERVAISDGCVWPQARAPRASTTLPVVSRVSNNETIANVPAVFHSQNATAARMDLTLVPQRQVESKRTVCEGATSVVRTTVLEVEARSFAIRVERSYQGVEGCESEEARRHAGPPLPTASCASVEELHFELEGSLCPARCAFQPSLEAGVFSGTCRCGRN